MTPPLSSFNQVNLLQPPRITFGPGCAIDCIDYLVTRNSRRILLLGSGTVITRCPEFSNSMKAAFPETIIRSGIPAEPTVADLDSLLDELRETELDTVVAMGGGSVLDVAKLVSVLHQSGESVTAIFGKDLVKERRLGLVCLPTTSGSGSEVSPNSILYDPVTESKQAAISPLLVADAAFIDPCLTLSLPADLTAATGFDALCHCIEAYTNRNAHPIVDQYAETGIRLLGANLKRAVTDGPGIEARSALSLGSLYGGLCLGPVNTAGVHALSYPLGSTYRLAHGLSNALLLPAVMEFNIPASPARHARIARLLGAKDEQDEEKTAHGGIQLLRKLMAECGLPAGIRELGIEEGIIPDLARAAMKVERLLKNNPRPIQQADAEFIYQQSY